MFPDVHIQTYEYSKDDPFYGELIALEVVDEEVDNKLASCIAIMAPCFDIRDVGSITAKVVDKHTVVVEHPTYRHNMKEEYPKWIQTAERKSKDNNSVRFVKMVKAFMTSYKRVKLQTKTTLKFKFEISNEVFSSALPDGTLDRMMIPYVYEFETKTKKGGHAKTFHSSESHVVFRPYVIDSLRDLEEAGNVVDDDDELEDLYEQLGKLNTV